jgi:hypothetical protein
MSQTEEQIKEQIAYNGFLDLTLFYLISKNDQMQDNNDKIEFEEEIKFWNEKAIELNKPHLAFDEIVKHIVYQEEFEDLNDSLEFGKHMYHNKEGAIHFLNTEKRYIPRTKSFLIQLHKLNEMEI